MPDLSFNLHDRFGEARDGLRYRVRTALTPANLWAVTKNLLWLAPLTILIWYTAERSRLEDEPFSVELKVRATRADRQVIGVEPQTVQLRARGRRNQLEQFRSRLGNGLHLTLEDANEVGVVFREMEQLVNASDARRSSEVLISSVTPQRVRLSIDQVVTREVPVSPPPGVDNLQSATFDPPAVTVRGPATWIASAEQVGNLVAYADITNLPILRTPGKKNPLNVPVRTPVQGVSVEPAEVTAALEVRESDVSLRLESVPVFAALPPAIMEQYRVTIEPAFIYNVTVLGPPDRIALLRGQQVSQVMARLDFLPGEVDAIRAGQSGSKRPTFVLPEGLRVDEEIARATTVTWSSQRREN
jgi:hypothetical protein